MSTVVDVLNFVVKSHNKADEVRTPGKSRIEIVRLNGFTIGRLNLEPGWKWSANIKPLVKTDTCHLSHVGYAISGRLIVRLKNGTQKTITAGDSYTIPPEHDAWVDGNESFVGIEVLSADEYTKM